ncbi:MAG: hypothetical protein ACWGMZ_09225, partial [Thermoguttaceae bacterium]
MDKLKLLWTVLKKYYFWFVSAVIVFLVLISWWFSTQSLANQFQQEAKQINDQFSAVKTLDNDSQPPNKALIDAVNKRHEKLKKGVLELWKTLYD